jgi:hypothetical protein
MQIKTVPTGYQGNGLLEIVSQFLGRARLAWIIAGNCQPAPKFLTGVLKTAHVIALPTVDGDRLGRKLPKRLLDIHAQFAVAVPGHGISLIDRINFFHLLGRALNDFPIHIRMRSTSARPHHSGLFYHFRQRHKSLALYPMRSADCQTKKLSLKLAHGALKALALVDRIIHRDHVGRRHIRQDVVNLLKHEAAARLPDLD